MSAFEERNRRLIGKRPYSKTAVDTAGRRWRDGEPYDPEPIEDFLEFNATFLSDLLEIAEETARSLRVSDFLCAGAWFTSSPRIGRGKPRLVG